MSDMSEADEVSENRLRRAAQRRGLLLAISRGRDARAHGFGMYRRTGAESHTLVGGDHAAGYGYDYDVEGYTNGEL
jgi:hypothetical protein